jgi:hypothetical protein
LGVSKDGKMACILKSLADFDTLNDNRYDIEASDFVHDATNWGGCDYIERTCKLEMLRGTGRIIELESPITFFGVDDDMGHSYSWSFNVVQIREVEFGE